MADDVAIDFARMNQLVQLLSDADANITSVLAQLDSSVSLLDAQWSGAASEAYHRAHEEWARSLASMNGILSQAQLTAAAINERHQAAEKQVQRLWS
jgi:WXG100 family type VII secretion target